MTIPQQPLPPWMTRVHPLDRALTPEEEASEAAFHEAGRRWEAKFQPSGGMAARWGDRDGEFKHIQAYDDGRIVDLPWEANDCDHVLPRPGLDLPELRYPLHHDPDVIGLA